MAILFRSGGGYLLSALVEQSCMSYCVLLSALTYAFSPTSLNHTPHTTQGDVYSEGNQTRFSLPRFPQLPILSQYSLWSNDLATGVSIASSGSDIAQALGQSEGPAEGEGDKEGLKLKEDLDQSGYVLSRADVARTIHDISILSRSGGKIYHIIKCVKNLTK